MPYKVTSQPASEPVTLTEAKAYLKVTTSAEDDLITELITTARIWVEKFCRVGLLPQTILETFNHWPRGRKIPLSISPLRSISSISYLDSAGNAQTWASSNYVVDLVTEPPVVQKKYSNEFPTLYDQINSVSAVYTVGWDSASAVPLNYKKAIYSSIADFYDNRTNYVKRLPTEVEYYLTSTGGRKFTFPRR